MTFDGIRETDKLINLRDQADHGNVGAGRQFQAEIHSLTQAQRNAVAAEMEKRAAINPDGHLGLPTVAVVEISANGNKTYYETDNGIVQGRAATIQRNEKGDVTDIAFGMPQGVPDLYTRSDRHRIPMWSEIRSQDGFVEHIDWDPNTGNRKSMDIRQPDGSSQHFDYDLATGKRTAGYSTYDPVSKDPIQLWYPYKD